MCNPIAHIVGNIMAYVFEKSFFMNVQLTKKQRSTTTIALSNQQFPAAAKTTRMTNIKLTIE